MENELKIKILSNSNGEKVSLDNITIDAADALKVFIESLSDFAKSYNYNSDVKLSIKNGSIETVLIYPSDKTEISEDINEIVAGKSFETHRTKLFKNIQDKIKLNGLEYSVLLKENDIETDLTKNFKDKNFPIRRGKKVQLKFEIIFLNGEIFEAGGKSKTNVHITVGDKDYKIDCTKPQATAMGSVYSRVNLSVLKKWRTESSIEYILIENYLIEKDYNYFKNLHEEFKKKNTLEKYDYLHDKVVEIFENKDLHTNNLIKLLRLYNNQYTDKDRGIVRTLLMSIKPLLKDNDEISYYYNEVAKRFRYGSKLQKI
ncbi:hypothetical protein MQX03_07655 [Chryseobacterium aahli]|uniref:hypothetical protein n=1 Tax=Chryseobacterium aahli TaxID=1278643 RepID=UPI001F625EF4|nr:hypothetical protein [Chryseobacterium aahli]MCI3937071.1 hypothetical protein [Chryseobacterium aahli]